MMVLHLKFVFKLIFHKKGRQMFSKVVRNATEITYLSNVQYYDFSHQYINFLNPPVTIYPVKIYLLILIIVFKYFKINRMTN
jgi:hypothetical protein